MQSMCVRMGVHEFAAVSIKWMCCLTYVCSVLVLAVLRPIKLSKQKSVWYLRHRSLTTFERFVSAWNTIASSPGRFALRGLNE
jgi:hypothetical protein